MAVELVALTIIGSAFGLLMSAVQAVRCRLYLRGLIAHNRRHFEQISPRNTGEFLAQLEAGRPVIAVDRMWEG